jgi:hypothetical protein
VVVPGQYLEELVIPCEEVGVLEEDVLEEDAEVEQTLFFFEQTVAGFETLEGAVEAGGVLVVLEEEFASADE